MNTEVMFSSKTDQWATPQWFFDELDEEFKFTLDPCADRFNHKCSKYYTKEQDGLSKDWGGETVFCNPPYGREIPQWVQKCFDEVYSGRCLCAVMLIPARTDTQWFHKYIYKRAEIRFVKGRLKFGDSTNSAPFPSMVVVFRNEVQE
jgi:site-specific DNA-methyltransferase (adenine-specific)